MAKITVDRNKFSMAADKIEDHIQLMKNEMLLIKACKQELDGVWEGQDKIAFDAKYEELTNKKSTFDNYIKTLEGYANFIKNADELYRKAQEDAYNKACKI